MRGGANHETHLRGSAPCQGERRPWFRNLGLGLGLFRELHGFTQVECAKRAGLTRAQLSRYETAVVPPTLENLDKVLQALEVSPAEFLLVVAAVDLLVAGEPIAEIRRLLAERQRAVLDAFLGGLERVARRGRGKGSLSHAGGRCPSIWQKILPVANLRDPEQIGMVGRLHEELGDRPGEG